MSHPDGTIWRAGFKIGDRIARGCIERVWGEYLCSVDGKPFGRAGDLATVQASAYFQHGIPLHAWSLDPEAT